MKKPLIQTLVVLIALSATAGSFAQSPSATRQRRTAGDVTQPVANTNTTASDDKTADSSPEKDKTKPPEVTADGKTNRVDEDSEAQAIVPYYNNFFTNYRLGPDDVISVNVFQ